MVLPQLFSTTAGKKHEVVRTFRDSDDHENPGGPVPYHIDPAPPVADHRIVVPEQEKS